MSLSALVFLGRILLLVLAISGSDKVPNGRFCSLTSDEHDVCQNLGDKIWEYTTEVVTPNKNAKGMLQFSIEDILEHM